MGGVDTRNAARASLFMLTHIKLENNARQYQVKVRNLSAKGMMAEGTCRLRVGRGFSYRWTMAMRSVERWPGWKARGSASLSIRISTPKRSGERQNPPRMRGRLTSRSRNGTFRYEPLEISVRSDIHVPQS